MTTRSRDESQEVLDRYLAAVSRRLTGSASRRRDVVAELSDGLRHARDGQVDRGASPEAAGHAATREFGDPATVAASFASELAMARARCVTFTLVRTGPVVGSLWLWAALTLFPGGPLDSLAAAAGPATISVLVVGIGLVAVATLAVALTTGPGARCLPDRPRIALGTAVVASLATIVCDGLVLATVGARAVGLDAVTTPLSLAAVASLMRGVATVAAWRRCRHSMSQLVAM